MVGSPAASVGGRVDPDAFISLDGLLERLLLLALKLQRRRVDRQASRRQQLLPGRVLPRLLLTLQRVGERVRVLRRGPPGLPPLQLVQRRVVERIARAQHGEQQPVVVPHAIPDPLALVEDRLLHPMDGAVERGFRQQRGRGRQRLVPRAGEGARRRVAAQAVGGDAGAAHGLAGAGHAAAVGQRAHEPRLDRGRPPVGALPAHGHIVGQRRPLQLRLVHAVKVVERAVVAARQLVRRPMAGMRRAIAVGGAGRLDRRGERRRGVWRLGESGHPRRLELRQLTPRPGKGGHRLGGAHPVDGGPVGGEPAGDGADPARRPGTSAAGHKRRLLQC